MRQFDGRRAAEFAAANDERFVEQVSLFEIGEQGAIAFGNLSGEIRVPLAQVVVAVPGLSLAVPHLHVANAALNKPTGDQELSGFRIETVGLLDVLRFAFDVERVGGFHLHPIGELE